MKTVDWAASMAVARLLVRANDFHYAPGIAVSNVNGFRMLLYPKRGAIHKDLFLHGEREMMTTEFLKRSGVLGAGDVCLDVGANIGYYVLLESQLVGESGFVYALEPVKTNFALLKKNIALNRMGNVECFNVAAGKTDCQSEIFVSASSNLCSMVKENTAECVGSQAVQVVSLDNFLVNKRFPSLLRMDPEGYEYQILLGMPDALKRGVKVLVEVHADLLGEDLLRMLAMLERLGYYVRFCAFETKVLEGKVLRYLYKKAGYDLPAVYYNLSVSRLADLLQKHKGWCPNVLFDKL